MQTISTAAPITSICIINNDKTLLAASGVVSGSNMNDFAMPASSPILSKTLQNGEEVYLPDLQILPGKVEFTYLPINCQSVVILPIADSGALIIGTNQAKSLKVMDLKRIRATAQIFSNL